MENNNYSYFINQLSRILWRVTIENPEKTKFSIDIRTNQPPDINKVFDVFRDKEGIKRFVIEL